MCQRLGQHSFCVGHLHKKKRHCVCAVFETSSLAKLWCPPSCTYEHCGTEALPVAVECSAQNFHREHGKLWPLSPENWHTGTIESVCIFVRHGSYPVIQDPSHIFLKTCITIICESHCAMHPCPGPPTHHHNLSGPFQGWEGRNVRNRLPPS